MKNTSYESPKMILTFVNDEDIVRTSGRDNELEPDVNN